jgi:hypothetical protein
MKRLFNILILVTAFSCNNEEQTRPSSVPKDAIWKGGADGGCWILFNSITSNTLNLVIYYQDGGIWEQGIYKKIGNCDIPVNEVENSIVGFNGQELIFKDNSCDYQKSS